MESLCYHTIINKELPHLKTVENETKCPIDITQDIPDIKFVLFRSPCILVIPNKDMK